MNPTATLLTWGKLYSYITRNGDLPVSIHVFPTNTLGEINHLVHFKIVEFYEKSKSIGLWFRIDTRPEDFLWVQRLYPNEKVKGLVNDILYDYFYFVPNIAQHAPLSKIKLSTPPRKIWDLQQLDRLPKKKPHREVDIMQTIFQKPVFSQKPQHYDFYQEIQQRTAHYKGHTKRILIVCGLEAYIKKKTTEWIRKLYPNHKLEIINTGQTGQHYFKLGSSEFPQQIKGEFDLIVLEFCPINIFTYDNLYFLYKKLKEEGFVLFLYSNHRLLIKSSFKKFIDRELGKSRQKTLTFQVLDS